MKIIVDENIAFWRETFSRYGEVVPLPGRTLTAGMVKDADCLIVRSVTPVNSELLEGSRIKFVGTCTIGRDHIDEAYLASRGVEFAHAAGCNANAVAEFVVMVLLARLRRVGGSLKGSSVGIVGLGNVGQALAKVLNRFDLKLLVSDPPLQRRGSAEALALEAQLNFEFSSLDALLASSDIVCLHTPLLQDSSDPTFQLIATHNIEQFKQGAILLNAGRGGVVSEKALGLRPDLQLLLDVWEGEPYIEPETLKRALIATPHVAGYSWLGKFQGTLMVAKALGVFLRTADEKPLVTQPSRVLDIDVKLTGEALLDQICRMIYDPYEDDRRLREGLLEHEPGVGRDRGALSAFDLMRKNYQPRLEWRQISLRNGKTLRLSDQSWLQQLGFTFC